MLRVKNNFNEKQWWTLPCCGFLFVCLLPFLSECEWDNTSGSTGPVEADNSGRWFNSHLHIPWYSYGFIESQSKSNITRNTDGNKEPLVSSFSLFIPFGFLSSYFFWLMFPFLTSKWWQHSVILIYNKLLKTL